MSTSGTPTVSVCIPTYNYGRYLGQAVESVLAQTYEDFELLVVDDASSDDTEVVIEKFINDPRVTFVRNPQNLGLFANFNACLPRSNGRYVKFLCADDWLHPEFLADTVALLEGDRSLAIASTASYRTDDDGQTIGVEYAPYASRLHVDRDEVIEALADWQNVIGMPSANLLRLEDLERVGGFDGKFAPAADVHLWLKLLQSGDLGYVAEPRCYTRVHDTHAHTYGPDPTEAMYLVWEDAAGWPETRVSGRVLERALYGEAKRVLLYVGAHVAALRLSRARRLLDFTGRHVRWRRVLPRFAWQLPGMLRDQARRVYAIRTGRVVVYSPRPHIGAPRAPK